MLLLQAAISATTSTTHVLSRWEDFKTFSEGVKAWAEAFGFAAAGGFFIYKMFSGYLIANLNLSVNCERKASSKADVDLLVVTALVKKGDRGAVTLHDAEARISTPAPNEAALKKLSSITRLSFKRSDTKFEIEEKQSKTSPLLNLSPGEETMFSTVFEVISREPCTIEVTILGGWRWQAGTAYQWRASQVSLPR